MARSTLKPNSTPNFLSLPSPATCNAHGERIAGVVAECDLQGVGLLVDDMAVNDRCVRRNVRRAQTIAAWLA
jgi:hypothetical protein